MVSASGITAIPIRNERDVVLVKNAVRHAASRMGLAITDATRVAVAASELARNIIDHAIRGGMVLRHIKRGPHVGLELEFSDEGPGIADVDHAMAEVCSTGRTGVGLRTAKAVMDEVRITSRAGRGTRVVAKKWRRHK